MKIIHLSYPLQLSNIPLPDTNQAIAIGYFDGVHRGHQKVIERTIEIGQRLNIPTSVLTFHPHPREVLGKSVNHQYLTSLLDKLAIFSQMGVDYTYIITFDHALSQVKPQQFIEEVLIKLKVQTAVVGYNFTFGHMGKGTPHTLSDSLHVEIVDPYEWDHHHVSTTEIRDLLQLGNIARANELLGRKYCLSGTVVRGYGRGRTLGFPTANIEVNDCPVIPHFGVYAVDILINGQLFYGVMNIGMKPTFHDNLPKPTLEVHILNFAQDLYGQTVKVYFTSFLRDEQKFASVDQLLQQIHQDIEDAQSLKGD